MILACLVSSVSSYGSYLTSKNSVLSLVESRNGTQRINFSPNFDQHCYNEISDILYHVQCGNNPSCGDMTVIKSSTRWTGETDAICVPCTDCRRDYVYWFSYKYSLTYLSTSSSVFSVVYFDVYNIRTREMRGKYLVHPICHSFISVEFVENFLHNTTVYKPLASVKGKLSYFLIRAMDYMPECSVNNLSPLKTTDITKILSYYVGDARDFSYSVDTPAPYLYSCSADSCLCTPCRVLSSGCFITKCYYSKVYYFSYITPIRKIYRHTIPGISSVISLVEGIAFALIDVVSALVFKFLRVIYENMMVYLFKAFDFVGEVITANPFSLLVEKFFDLLVSFGLIFPLLISTVIFLKFQSIYLFVFTLLFVYYIRPVDSKIVEFGVGFVYHCDNVLADNFILTDTGLIYYTYPSMDISFYSFPHLVQFSDRSVACTVSGVAMNSSMPYSIDQFECPRCAHHSTVIKTISSKCLNLIESDCNLEVKFNWAILRTLIFIALIIIIIYLYRYGQSKVRFITYQKCQEQV